MMTDKKTRNRLRIRRLYFGKMAIRSVYINISHSRMQINLYSFRLIEILYYLCSVKFYTAKTIIEESRKENGWFIQ